MVHEQQITLLLIIFIFGIGVPHEINFKQALSFLYFNANKGINFINQSSNNRVIDTFYLFGYISFIYHLYIIHKGIEVNCG